PIPWLTLRIPAQQQPGCGALGRQSISSRKAVLEKKSVWRFLWWSHQERQDVLFRKLRRIAAAARIYPDLQCARIHGAKRALTDGDIATHQAGDPALPESLAAPQRDLQHEVRDCAIPIPLSLRPGGRDRPVHHILYRTEQPKLLDGTDGSPVFRLRFDI